MMPEKLDAWILKNDDKQDRSMDWFHDYKLTVPVPLVDLRDTLIGHLSELYGITEERTGKKKQGRRYHISENGGVLFARFSRKKALDRYAEITGHLGWTFILFWAGDKERIIETFSRSFRMHEEVPEKYRPTLPLEKGELKTRWQVNQLPVVTEISQSDKLGPRGRSKGWVVEVDQCGGPCSLDKALRTPLCSVVLRNRRDLIYYRQFGWPFWRVKFRLLSFGADKVRIEYYGRKVNKILRRLVIHGEAAEEILKANSESQKWEFSGALIADPEVEKVYQEATAAAARKVDQPVSEEAASAKE